MKIGASYMGHHDPKYIEEDIREMQQLKMDDVLLAAQENDFFYFPGKLRYLPKIARDHGIRPIAIFWGALNLFGGGRSSQFLLEHPEGFQVAKDGSHLSEGCYVNPVCVGRIQQMVDIIAEMGYEGYFVDEPTPLRDCYCPACCKRFEEWYSGSLAKANHTTQEEFRQRCVIEYVKTISDYCKANHPALETMCCLMPMDKTMWLAAAQIPGLDNLGTDIYWINENNDVEQMRPMVREIARICQQYGKIHHEWLQNFVVRREKENRVLEQGKILVQEQPDALYAWAWKGQIGTAETCEDPLSAWEKAVQVFRWAKEGL